jgi:hypothetical protein
LAFYADGYYAISGTTLWIFWDNKTVITPYPLKSHYQAVRLQRFLDNIEHNPLPNQVFDTYKKLFPNASRVKTPPALVGKNPQPSILTGLATL